MKRICLTGFFVLLVAMLGGCGKDTTGATVEQTAGDQIIALGANRDTWDRNHEKAEGFVDGSAYSPILKISVDGSSRDQPKYSAVNEINGVISSYTLYFENGTNNQLAENEVLRELPADAKAIASTQEPRCNMVEYESMTLNQSLPGYYVFAAYYSGSGDYNAANTSYAILTFSKLKNKRC